MNRNQYEQDERMHRGAGRERELERQRNQQFQGQYSRAQRFQDMESGYAGSGAYAQMDDDFYERDDGNRMQRGRYASGSGGYGGMERQWQSPSEQQYGHYGQSGYSPSQYGQSPYGQSQFNQGWSESPQYGGSQFGQERWQSSTQHQGGQYGQPGYLGQQGQYGQQYGQQGLYGQQGQYGQQGGSSQQSQYGQVGGYSGLGRESLGSQQGMLGSQQGLYGSQGLRGQQLGQLGQENFRGRGPKGYTRSDERIKEEVCERLTRHPEIDASDIEIEAKQGVITLTGSVDQRHLKYQVEDLVENVSGVKDIENRITVKSQSSQSQAGSSRGGQQVGVTTGSLGGSSESKPRH